MSAPVAMCRLCHEPIQYRTQAVVAVRGYERLRKQGGQNAVLFKERVPDWIAHEDCLERYKRGDRLFELSGGG